MSIQTIDRLSPLSESIRNTPGRIRAALAEKALQRRVGRTTDHINHLQEETIAAEVTQQGEFTAALTKVHELAEFTRADETDVIAVAKVALDESAEHLFNDIKNAESQGGNRLDLGLTPVLDALHAWDIARTDATRNLAAVALNHFHGGAQANLVAAFNATEKDSSSSFEDELGKIITSAAA